MKKKNTIGRFPYYKAQATWLRRLLRRRQPRPHNDNSAPDLQLTQAELEADLNYGRG